MAFLDFLRGKKNRKKNTEHFEFLDPELDLEREFARRKKNAARDEEFDRIENMQFVRTQCDQVVESSRYIAQLKGEYQSVSDHLLDVQKIDTAPPGTRASLKALANDALNLDSKRNEFHKKKTNLPGSRFDMFERYKDEFPEALTNLQNDESYLQTVKHDMKMLEAEKACLKRDMEDSKSHRVVVRNFAFVCLFAMAAVFIIFLAAGLLQKPQGQLAFMIVLAVAMLIVMLLVVGMRNSTYRHKLAEKKMARAITLLNKTKIKYVNIANSVEYQKTKFSVKNSYQLSHEYELYLMDVKAMERYKNSTRELDKAIVAINQILRSLELYDVGVWESQLQALADEREMVEIRHSLNTRRQKLREQIDYNMGRIEEAKRGVLGFMKKHPEESQAIMEIVDSYEMDIE